MSDVLKPIRLVHCDDNGKFHMDPEAVSILEHLKGPIGVVSIWGPTKHGKSFLMNQGFFELLSINEYTNLILHEARANGGQLLRTRGFQLGRAIPVQRRTKGLWMWSSPSTETAADGTEYNLLLIEMEGIDRCAEVQEYFYLALVLSSMSILNQMGLIHEISLHILSYLTTIADINAGDTTASELRQFSPIFVWLLRDFTLPLVGMSPTEYMESALKQVDVTCERHDFDNKVRKSLQTVFTERHCFTLVLPSFKGKHLLALDRISNNRLRPKFRKEIGEFTSFVFKNTKPKKIGATVMTGPIFVQITQEMLKAFNSGTLPLMAHIRENVEKTNHPKAWESATTATVVDSPPAANRQKRKRSIQQKDVGP